MGAEIPATLLFADIRGSTSFGERLSPTDFRSFLDGFDRIATSVVTSHDGLLDKFVGDEAIGLFFQGASGPRHVGAAIAAARDLLERVAAPGASVDGPISAAVHTGPAFVGSTGSMGQVTDFTALGDVVNTTARLASAAAADELLVSVDAATEAGLDDATLERRTLDVRGRSNAIDVLVIEAAARPTPAA